MVRPACRQAGGMPMIIIPLCEKHYSWTFHDSNFSSHQKEFIMAINYMITIGVSNDIYQLCRFTRKKNNYALPNLKSQAYIRYKKGHFYPFIIYV